MTPFERVVVLNVVDELQVELRRFEPAAIGDALARVAGATAMAVMHRFTTLGEARAMAIAERQQLVDR